MLHRNAASLILVTNNDIAFSNRKKHDQSKSLASFNPEIKNSKQKNQIKINKKK